MPSKKKKYNARFPPARIKKIMQTDEEVGKVAAAVPVIISRALELFIDSLIEKTASVTRAKNAKTLSSSHVFARYDLEDVKINVKVTVLQKATNNLRYLLKISSRKQAIHSEKMFDFLRDLVKNVPDHQTEEEMDTAVPSGSGVVEKKPKVPRPRKPREDGARGRGRPRKVKVEEKKGSESEGSDEETETDEEQTADEDCQSQQQFNPAQGECSTQPPHPQMCNTQMMSQEQPGIPVMSQDQCGTQGTPQGLCGSTQPKDVDCDQTLPQKHFNTDNLPQGTLMQQDPNQVSMAGMPQRQASPNTQSQTPLSADNKVQHSVISTIQGEVTSAQYPAQTFSQQSMPLPQQFPPPGFPMQNMMFPQYPFMGGGQPMPYMHPQMAMAGVPPSSTAGNNPTPQTAGNVPPQFIPGHPAYMMPPLGQNGPMLPMGLGMPRLPVGPPPPLVPTNTVKNTQDRECETNVPLDMSLAGKSRSQTSTVANSSVSQMPAPHGMPSLSHMGFQPPVLPELHQIPHPQGFPQWRMNNQINQNIHETGFRSQISGPPPLVSSTVTQSTASVTENGKHKQSDDSAEIASKNSKQKNTSGNPSDEQKPLSFPGLANIMNTKTVKTVKNDDEDYDT